jgi:uncharacterized membrane protein YoaK (UPF0700 family)
MRLLLQMPADHSAPQSAAKVGYSVRVLRLNSRTRRLAAALSALAGYVDAVGFLSLGGFFVSFMSGNSTRLAVGAAEHSADALEAFGLITTFVIGVAAGTAIARRSRQAQSVVIGFVATLLGLAALLSVAGRSSVAGFVLALAMGVENSAFVAEGGLPVGLTYMTGTLVKLGQLLGSITTRHEMWQWWPYAVHWLALLAGALGGALAFKLLGSAALWPAAAAAGLLMLATRQATVDSAATAAEQRPAREPRDAP